MFQSHNLQVEESVLDEVSTVPWKSNLLAIATAYKHAQYYISHFGVVEPIEYILDAKRNRTFQYIPILQSLQHLLSHKGVLEHLQTQQNQLLSGHQEYRTIRDGEYYKQNPFLSNEVLRLAVNLHVDYFKICNPLGISQKKQKLCGVYWILDNLETN